MSLHDTLNGSHLVIAPDFTSARFQLLAMDESLAAQIEEGAQCVLSRNFEFLRRPFHLTMHRLTIKGSEDSEAVLCSATATYSLRVVESSNSTLLARDSEAAPPSSDPDESQRVEERTVLALGSVPHVWEVSTL